MVVTNSSSHFASEFTKQIRQNSLPPVAADYAPIKLKAKNSTTVTYFRAEDDWKLRHDRHEAQGKQGFFSPLSQPYQALGSLELNSRALVVDAMTGLGFRIKGKIKKGQEKQYERKDAKIRIPPTRKRSDENLDIKDSYTAVPRRSCKASDDGRSDISECLHETIAKITSVKAGQPLSSCLKKEVQLKELEEMEKVKRDNTKEMVILDPVERVMIMNTNTSEENEEDWKLRDPGCRLQRSFLAKLDCLYRVFCCVMNMKTKDLRTKIPLSMDAVKNLFKECSSNQVMHYQPNALSRMARRLTTAAFFMSLPTRNHFLSNDMSFSDKQSLLGSPKFPFAPSVILEERSNHSSRSVAPPSDTVGRQDYLALPPKAKRLGSITSRMTSYGREKYQTWNEFLNNTPGCPRDGGENSGIIKIKSIQSAKHQFLGLLKPRRGGVFIRKDHPPETKAADLPPWQKIPAERKEEDALVCRHKAGKGTSKPSGKLDSMVTLFEKIKEKHKKKSQEDLEEKACFYQQRLEFMELSHLRDESLRALREKVRNWQKEVSANAAKPPEWFQQISSDAKDIGLKDNPEARIKIDKLSTFTHTDMANVHSLKAKLCLLVYSLPAYELCKMEMQESLKFFLENVMCTKPDTLKDWMKQRNLYHE